MNRTKPILRTVLVCLFFCALFWLTACGRTDSAADLPALPDGSFVYDEAGILRGDTKEHIRTENESRLSRFGTQAAVACVRDTDGLPVSEYARQLFLAWELGSRGEETGVLLLLCPGEDGYWCLQSRALETTLSDDRIAQILHGTLEPCFLAGDYDEGVRLAFDALAAALCRTADSADSTDSAETDREPAEAVTHRESSSNVLAWAVIAVLILLLILHFVLVSEKQPRRQKRHTVYASPRPRRVTGSRPSSLRQPVAPPRGRPRSSAYPSRPNRPNASPPSGNSAGMRRR